MDESLLLEMEDMAERHWWFRGRRAIVSRLLSGHLRRGGPLTLGDFGCGTGHMLETLRRFGTAYGMDDSPLAVTIARRKGAAVVRQGRLPDGVPFEERFFDAIILLDVLEHIERDGEALAAILRCLKPDGIVLLTVPACPSLYTARDRFHSHFRRYTRDGLRRRFVEGGLDVVLLSYYNTLLFLPAAIARTFSRSTGTDEEAPDLSLPPRSINNALETVFASERFWLASGKTFPFGLSLIAVGRRSLQ